MTLVEHAERATLGALLLQPEQIANVHPWLMSRDFTHPKAAAVYRLLLALSDDGTVDPHALLASAARATDPVARTIDGPYVHLILSAPPDEHSAAVYGRLILEASISRQVAAAAMRLEQAASREGTSLDVLERTLPQLEGARDTTLRLNARWRQAGGGSPESLLTGRPDPTASDRPNPAERELLAALLRHPRELHDVEGFLSPRDFMEPAHRAVYESMLAAHSRGESVDVLTVTWQAQRLVPGGGLTVEALSDLMSQAPPGGAAVLAQTLVAGTVVARVRAVASDLERRTGAHPPEPEKLLASAESALSRLTRDAVRIRASVPSALRAPASPNQGGLHAATRL